MAYDNSPFGDELSVPARHVNIANPQIVDGIAVLGEVGGDVAALEELPARNAVRKPEVSDMHGRCLSRCRRQKQQQVEDGSRQGPPPWDHHGSRLS